MTPLHLHLACGATQSIIWHEELKVTHAGRCPSLHVCTQPTCSRFTRQKPARCLHDAHGSHTHNHLYSYSPQAPGAHSGPTPPLCACLSPRGIISQKSLRFHPQVRPETATAQSYYTTIVAILRFARPLKRILLPQRAKAVLTHPAL